MSNSQGRNGGRISHFNCMPPLPYCDSLTAYHLWHFQVIDKHEDAILLLLDLSAAFDTIEHQVLLKRLHQRFGFRDLARKWLASYLADRKQSVHIRSAVSVDSKLRFGVPQGSVVEPVLFPCMLLTWRILSFLTASVLCSTLTITVRFTSQWGSAIEMYPSVKLKIVQATLLVGIPTQQDQSYPFFFEVSQHGLHLFHKY